jgi:hypothetical protein
MADVEAAVAGVCSRMQREMALFDWHVVVDPSLQVVSTHYVHSDSVQVCIQYVLGLGCDSNQ